MFKLFLNHKIYSKESILKAIDDYSGFMDAEILDEGFNITITPKKEFKEENLKEEFCNYILGLMKNC